MRSHSDVLTDGRATRKMIAELRRAIISTADEKKVSEGKTLRLLNPKAAVDRLLVRWSMNGSGEIKADWRSSVNEHRGAGTRLPRYALFALAGAIPLACIQNPAHQPVPLEWTACPFPTEGLDTTRIRCGFFTVPENRDDDRGRRLRLAFAVIRRTTTDSADDAILHLVGGPGLPALTDLFIRVIAPGLAQDRDVVTFDQRGTGYSQPRMCPQRIVDDTRIAALPGNGAERRRLLRVADLACRDELLRDSVDLSQYNSRASADDAEDLRVALGYGQWTLLGTSYGGALAQSVMNRHPASVRAAVLNVPVRFSDAHEFDFVRAIGGSLRELNSVCTADDVCRRDHPDLEREFYQVAEGFAREPMTLAVDSATFGRATFTVDAADFITVIDETSIRDWELKFIPPLLRAFGARDSVVVRAAMEHTFGSSGPSGFSPGMQMTVRCHDFVFPDTRRRWQAVIDSFPLEGEMWFGQDPCDEWPSGRASRVDREPAASRIPTLILSGRFDNRVPASYGPAIMTVFQNSRQIVFPNAAHTMPGPTTFTCFRELVVAFARQPDVFPDDTCSRATVPVTVSALLPDWAR